MLTKTNTNWSGFSVKGKQAQPAPVQQAAPQVDNTAVNQLKELMEEFTESVIPLEAETILNGVSNVPFERKKKLVYLKYLELYLEAQLTEVREKQQALLEEDLEDEGEH